MHTLKIFSLLLILLSLIVFAGIFSVNNLKTSSKLLENQLLNVENYTKDGNWEKADFELVSLNNKWENMSKFWASLIDHIEIDNIDTSLVKMEKYIYIKDLSMSLAELSVLRQYIKHIPKKESFSLENIF